MSYFVAIEINTSIETRKLHHHHVCSLHIYLRTS